MESIMKKIINDGAGAKTDMVSNPAANFENIPILSQVDIKINTEKKYWCFSILDLFKDLFIMDKNEKRAFVNLKGVSRKHDYVLAFLLPEDLMSKIDSNPKIKKPGTPNDHYSGFFNTRTNDIIIYNKILDRAKEGYIAFFNEVRKHIMEQIESAEFPCPDELKAYLEEVGDTIIVPKAESEKANKEFHSLLNKGDKASVKLIIANFFASSLIGLRSMNYDKDSFIKENPDKKAVRYPSAKTYLLSETGMEYVWVPELHTPARERLDTARQLYKSGSYKAAFKEVNEWMAQFERKANVSDLAIAHRIYGFSLSFLSTKDDDYKNRQAEAIEYLEKSFREEITDYYVCCYLYDYWRFTDKTKAANYLKPAYDANYPGAVNRVTGLFLKGEQVFDDVTEDILVRKIGVIVTDEKNHSPLDVGESLYLLGRICKNNSKDKEAQSAYESAASLGNEKAMQEVSRKKRLDRRAFPSFMEISENDSSEDKTDYTKIKHCFANADTGANRAALSTFPDEEWLLFTACKSNIKGAKEVPDIDSFISVWEKNEFKCARMVFLLMSENKENNLNDCLVLLDRLFNIVLDKSEEERQSFIKPIDIFVGAKYETASLMIDANINDMGNGIYFKVHIMDECRDTAHKLLCDAPLFIPALSRIDKADYTNVVLLGASEMNYAILKESIACAYMGDTHPVKITIIGEGADKLEVAFRSQCPGINSNPNISCIRPRFINCPIDKIDFPSYLYGEKFKQYSDTDNDDTSAEKELVDALKNANYFVVDVADDLESIRLAADLRTWLLKSNDKYNRAPFIAVRCANENNSHLTSRLTLSGRAAGKAYFNSHNLFSIGALSDIYSYKNLIDNPVLNDTAFNIHLSYPFYEENTVAAENDFYSYSYNADSSLMTAIGLCYRFFVAGIAFDDRAKYNNFAFFESEDIVERYKEICEEKLDELAKLEQSRWNGFMLGRGWEPAGLSQVMAYKEQSSGLAHKHTLAKLHPFIMEWEDLAGDDLFRIMDVLKTKFDFNEHPISTTKKYIKENAECFKISKKKTSDTTH